MYTIYKIINVGGSVPGGMVHSRHETIDEARKELRILKALPTGKAARMSLAKANEIARESYPGAETADSPSVRAVHKLCVESLRSSHDSRYVIVDGDTKQLSDLCTSLPKLHEAAKNGLIPGLTATDFSGISYAE